MDRLLIFDLKGSIAHFRKFYTSSSSLSYSFPPRTTIVGLIAGLIGREKDSYYEEFGCDNCKIAVSIRKQIRKIMQTVNYIRTKKGSRTEKGEGGDGFDSSSNVIKHFLTKPILKYPTPLELIIPLRLTDEIVYRIYFYHQNNAVIDELSLMVKDGKTKYPLYLGLSEFLANAGFVTDVKKQDIKEYKSEEAIEIVSVCNVEHIRRLEFNDAIGTLQYIEEKMPLEFGSGRNIKRTANFVHEKNQRTIKAQLSIPSIEVTYTDKGQTLKENLTFME